MLKDQTLASRRQVLAGAALSAAVAIIGARSAIASPQEVEAELKKLFGDKEIKRGRVKLDIPQIAENGLVVPVGVEVESPMTADNCVRAIHLFTDGNPLPVVYSYRLTPDVGRAAVSNRIRLAKTQNVIAVAEMSDGSLYSAKSEVKVTIGGCGG